LLKPRTGAGEEHWSAHQLTSGSVTTAVDRLEERGLADGLTKGERLTLIHLVKKLRRSVEERFKEQPSNE